MIAPERIFRPVAVLALWTLAVFAWTGLVRVIAGRRGRVRSSDFKLGESARVPEDVALANRNLMNLLEAPVLFYVACLVLYVTRRVDAAAVSLAWAYVGLRLIHSVIHLSYNRVMHRLAAFAASNFVVATLWIRLAVRLLGHSTGH